jgi:PhnB protein
MSVTLNPYLHFNGNAAEAIEYYKTIFGGELTISHYGESGMPVEDEQKDLVMHADLQADDLRLMASDSGPMGTVTNGTNISISLSGDDEARLTKYFEALSAGGNVTVPMAVAPWGDSFGMVTDKLGIEWLVNILAKK